MRRSAPRQRSWGLCVAVLFGGGAAVQASQIVEFADGRLLRVEHAEQRGDQIVLTLEGGGAIAVPESRITALTPEAPPPPVEIVQAVLPAPWRDAAGEYASLFDRVAQEHGLDPVLLTAMAEVESAFDPAAVSSKGAQGLLQLMPATAARFGVADAFDPKQNVRGGAQYLSWLLDRYSGRMELALAGYNAGEGAVDRHRGIPPYRETRRYVAKVLEGIDRLASSAR